MPTINSNFKPAWWLKNPHLQTIWGKLFKPQCDITLQKQRIELEDGDFIDVAKTTSIQNKPIVLILHGLEGCLDSHYAKPIIKLLENAGYAVYFMHFRGCSGELNRLHRSYSSNDSADLQAVIEHIKKDNKRDVFAVIGFSLGGSVTLKWLGECKDKASTSVAIAISVPFLLRDSAIKLEHGFSQVYQRYLIRTCHKKFIEKQTKNKSLEPLDVKSLKTLYRFDDKVTAPLNGFNNAEDYYKQCSSRQFLKAIKKTTLILHAKDDPFMWKQSVPLAEELSDNVSLELAENGGHVGFIAGKFPWKAEYWLDQRIIQWLNQQRQIHLK